MSRKRYQESEKRKWVRRFNGYNSNAAAFCREFNLPYGSFMAWKRRYRRKPSKLTAFLSQQSEFIDLTVEPPSSPVIAVATDGLQRVWYKTPLTQGALARTSGLV
ncbi:hypothetical protein N8586_01790 [Verrucomicrobiales bacterium]|nr:hypothetical protein [Verrucomicrobiales bacterium]MDB4632534.1 hypothetical protein [bacterium]